MTRVTRRYGLPVRGLVSSVEKHQAPLGSVTGDSHDFLVVPGRGADVARLVRRRGSQIVGANTGLLEAPTTDATLVSRQGLELESPSLTDGYPTHAVLFADESKRYGQLYLRDTNGPTDYALGEEFSATHYPTVASTKGNLKAIPLPYDGNGATGMMRFATEENRRRHLAGSRTIRGIRDWIYGPSFLSCPSKWDRRYNHASGAGSQKVHIQPAGHPPPLFPPNFPAASYPTRKTASAPWCEGDTFFVSIVYEWEDGSKSMPFLPRDKNATLTAGLGLVVVDDDGDGTVEYFDYIPWRNLVIPPTGVKYLWLLRTPKKSKTEVAAGAWPDINDMRIVARVEAGVTSYDDPAGSDGALTADDTVYRTDHKWPDRARYNWTFDERHAMGYLRPNPCAIILAPTGSVSSRDLNADDDSSTLYGSVQFVYQITTTNLVLKKISGGATTTVSIALNTTKTIGQVVDEINATTVGSACGEWAAQLVPGVDFNTASSNLAPTTQDVVCAFSGSSTTITSAALFGDVAEGMRVYGTNIPAGAYVKSKASSSSLTISAVTTGAGPGTLTFAVDCGDDAIPNGSGDASKGNIRAVAASYYGICALKQSWLDRYNTRKRDWIFTGGGPTHARYAANNFYALSNRPSAPLEAGILMGGAPLRNGSVVFYANKIGWWVNTRGGSTGEDQDYRSQWLLEGDGCISPYSIVIGDNWVGCLTRKGFWVTDGTDSAIISGDVWDQKLRKGEWDYEVTRCTNAAAADTDDFHFFAHFREGVLLVCYRNASGVTYDHLRYDCSPSRAASGLAQILMPDGSPYPWSTKLRYSWRQGGSNGVGGAIFSVRKSDVLHFYTCDDKNDRTNCGLVQEIEVPGVWTDGSDVITEEAWFPFDMVDQLRGKKSLQSLVVLYKLTTVDAADVGTLLRIYRDQQRTALQTRVLSRTGSDTFTRKVIPIPQVSRTGTEGYEFGIAGSADADRQDFEFEGMEAEFDLLDTIKT